ncbi:MAG: glycerol-3-phosphate acyltransferase [Opitutales bacterium]
MLYVITAILGYLLGSISFAYLICKSKGVDIFSVGSGNPGATNVTRAVGGFWGKVCFLADFLKGFIATGWPFLLTPGIALISTSGGTVEIEKMLHIHAWTLEASFFEGPVSAVQAAHESALLYGIIGYLGAILGHTFSLHLKRLTGKFRGGKAVATTMGGLLALSPPVFLTGIAIWAAVYFGFGRIVGLASVVFAAALPLLAWAWGEHAVVIWFLLLLGLFVIFKHRSNLTRLLKGEEQVFAKNTESQ